MSQLALMLLYIVGLGALWWFIGRKNRERNKKITRANECFESWGSYCYYWGLTWSSSLY